MGSWDRWMGMGIGMGGIGMGIGKVQLTTCLRTECRLGPYYYSSPCSEICLREL
nr:hypothetical protein Q903MT_gene4536 [Picea sitchensis]